MSYLSVRNKSHNWLHRSLSSTRNKYYWTHLQKLPLPKTIFHTNFSPHRSQNKLPSERASISEYLIENCIKSKRSLWMLSSRLTKIYVWNLRCQFYTSLWPEFKCRQTIEITYHPPYFESSPLHPSTKSASGIFPRWDRCWIPLGIRLLRSSAEAIL